MQWQPLSDSACDDDQVRGIEIVVDWEFVSQAGGSSGAAELHSYDSN